MCDDGLRTRSGVLHISHAVRESGYSSLPVPMRALGLQAPDVLPESSDSSVLLRRGLRGPTPSLLAFDPAEAAAQIGDPVGKLPHD